MSSPSTVTDEDGHAVLADLSEFRDEKKPVAFIARKHEDMAFLPYERDDRELNYSKFDVDGHHSVEGLQAYLFTDRGIYRPGETAHLGIIVKAKDWSESLTGLPLILEITNSRGQMIRKQILNLNEEGLIQTDFTSDEGGATGIYNAALYLGRDAHEKGAELGNIPLRIEEFLPDHMRMTTELTRNGKPAEGRAWVTPDMLQADVTLMQLYGSPAPDRRVTGKLIVSPGSFGFEHYKDYHFTAAEDVEKTNEETLPETMTDASGTAHFPLDLSQYWNSTFRLTFYAEGFEPDSGRSIRTAKSVLVSPFDFALGVKTDGNMSYVTPGEKRSVALLAMGPALKPVAADNMHVELNRIKNVQSLVSDSAGHYSFETNPVETLITSKEFAVPVQGTEYPLPTQTPGSYVLLYKNAQGMELARVPFTVVGEGNAMAGITHDASMIVTSDKSSYGTGETMALHIQSPYTGTGLITIETDHVHCWQWFKTSTNSTIQRVKIPDHVEGKAFINVQFTRDLHSKEIFRSPLSFAVVPFTVNVAGRDQKPVVSAPEDARPGDTVTVRYRSRKPGKIILYAIDEGILLYGHYHNPDPLDYFLMKRALEVKTSQIMDQLLPEYSLLKSLTQGGGDGFLNDGKNINPFKRKTEPPVAYWSGILPTDGTDRSWAFTVPGYFNGSIRVLAVSVSDTTLGAEHATVSVHNPLIVTLNLPLFAAPGDRFVTSVSIANHVKGSGKDAKLTLMLEPSEQLKVVDAPNAPIALPEGKEISVPVTLKATDSLGSGSLRFTAEVAGTRFGIAQMLSIRPPIPAMTQLTGGFAAGTTVAVPVLRSLYPQFADLRAAVSALPLSLVGGLRDYLNTSPYGCSEQVTSRSFPNVIFYGNAELARAFGWKQETMDDAIRASFDTLRERQGEIGGWGMWNYYSEPDGFISAYVMHFLIEAKERGLPVPPEMFNSGINFLKSRVGELPTSLEDAREKAYALYLLTRNGEVTSNYIPHVTDYLNSYHADTWHDDLAAVYLASTYRLLQMQKESAVLIDGSVPLRSTCALVGRQA